MRLLPKISETVKTIQRASFTFIIQFPHFVIELSMQLMKCFTTITTTATTTKEFIHLFIAWYLHINVIN